LLIAGGKLEYEVTAIAMNGLAHGFDVYVLGDILELSTDNYANLYWDRLIHAGVVPTTMVQMVVEWISSESDSKTSSIIRLAAERLMFFVN
jgi:hypothetical protein